MQGCRWGAPEARQHEQNLQRARAQAGTSHEQAQGCCKQNREYAEADITVALPDCLALPNTVSLSSAHCI